MPPKSIWARNMAIMANMPRTLVTILFISLCFILLFSSAAPWRKVLSIHRSCGLCLRPEGNPFPFQPCIQPIILMNRTPFPPDSHRKAGNNQKQLFKPTKTYCHFSDFTIRCTVTCPLTCSTIKRYNPSGRTGRKMATR